MYVSLTFRECQLSALGDLHLPLLFFMELSYENRAMKKITWGEILEVSKVFPTKALSPKLKWRVKYLLIVS